MGVGKQREKDGKGLPLSGWAPAKRQRKKGKSRKYVAFVGGRWRKGNEKRESHGNMLPL